MDEVEKGLVIESITDILNDDKWHYAKSLLRDVDLPGTNESVQKYILPLIDMFDLEKEGKVGKRLRIRKPQRNKIYQ